jgi:hypothetical protein
LEASVPKCEAGVMYLAGPDHVPSEANRCKRCGGCHILVIEEVIVESHEEAQRCRDEAQPRDET